MASGNIEGRYTKERQFNPNDGATKNMGAVNAFGTNKKHFKNCTLHFIKRSQAVILALSSKKVDGELIKM